AKAVKAHWTQAIAALGVPGTIKTDNGPAYHSKAVQQFCTRCGIKHTTRIPYNSTGQAVVERIHQI
ncbi:POK18 protein, partial [Heliornis fulica]|nr:POK18 protein [Heliornis fulica]